MPFYQVPDFVIEQWSHVKERGVELGRLRVYDKSVDLQYSNHHQHLLNDMTHLAQTSWGDVVRTRVPFPLSTKRRSVVLHSATGISGFHTNQYLWRRRQVWSKVPVEGEGPDVRLFRKK